MAVKVCLECGKEFEVFGTEYRQNHALYCSVECGKKYRRKASDAERLHTVICSECGTEFETMRANRTCCSEECMKERGRRRSRENGKMYRVKYKEAKEPKKKTPKEEAWEIEAEARKVGMNYGMYYALKQMEKERANRLRGTA